MKHFFKTISILVLTLLFSCGKDDDAPVNTAPVIKAQTFNFSEDLGSNNIIGRIVATDPEEDALTYSITAPSGSITPALFKISTTGDLSLLEGVSLDYETTPTHTVIVQVSDGDLSATATITVNVIDVDENVAPVMAAQTFSVAENTNHGIEIADIIASDANGNTLSYSITQNAFVSSSNSTPIFELLNQNSSKLSIASGHALDFETKTSYTLTIEVSDGLLTETADIIINVTNINEAPVIGDGSVINDVAEDIADTVVIGTIDATDPEEDTIIYSLPLNPGNLFEINDDGEISLAAGKTLDYETATSHTLTVNVSDGDAVSAESITINVTDVVENASSITVTTFAGSTLGDTNGIGTAAKFGSIANIIVGPSGNLYIADASNNTIRKINVSTAAVTKFSGSGNDNSNDGSAAVASYDYVSGFTYSTYLGRFFAADTGNHLIRQVTTAGHVGFWAGTGRGYVDGNGATAMFNNPTQTVADASGNLYVVDRLNQNIRKITPQKLVSTFAGSNDPIPMNRDGSVDGTGTAAKFDTPFGIAIDGSGNLYVTDQGNHRIRKITPSGVVSTLAGSSPGFADGTGTAAKFSSPNGITVDASGNVYVSDSGNKRIRKITPSGVVTTVAGTGTQQITNGGFGSASFYATNAIAIDADGNLYVGDTDGTQRLVRKITFNNIP
ncbi:cadherin domain-containing protein [Maribacter sp.]|uniref:cadherin domain-containing protein n=1 Tax=Maribacter sp. TaxID=1897614 RepID=UPI0025BF1C2F|nr:cadherin domain-containing protein [Maribacter sp.]